tara:strand:+ start:28386 stop:29324 length:939 start_codon:yes stop_codon:yes gene_type:complete
MTVSKKRNNRINLKGIIIISIAISINLILSKQMADWSYSWFPIQASLAAPYVDNLFAFETAVGTFIFLGCTSVMGWVLVFNRAKKYDESDGEPIEGNFQLEVIWTVIPLLLVLAIATYSTKINITLQNLGAKEKYNPKEVPPSFIHKKTPSNINTIDVISRQWSWEFIYPEGVNSSELHLPLNERVNLRLISKDVIHSLYIPAFRLKQDIIPGSIISFSMTPTKTGTFRLRDAMFSGAYFSNNQTNVIVETKESYKDWLRETGEKIPTYGLNPAQYLYQKRLEKGNKGWATVQPAPSPVVQDPGDAFRTHDS